MEFKRLADRAKNIFEKRGGSAAAREDLAELKDIAGKDESFGEKAKDAAAALRDPGAASAAPGMSGPAPSTTPTEPTTPDAPPPSDAPPPTEEA
jgi:hypothetical protein